MKEKFNQVKAQLRGKFTNLQNKLAPIIANPHLAVATQIAFAVVVSGLIVIANATQAFAAESGRLMELEQECFENGWFDEETEQSKAKLLDNIRK